MVDHSWYRLERDIDELFRVCFFFFGFAFWLFTTFWFSLRLRRHRVSRAVPQYRIPIHASPVVTDP